VIQKVFDEEPFDGRRVVEDPMITTKSSLFAWSALQPLKCRLARQCLPLIGITTTLLSLHIGLLAQGGNQGIVSKLIMIVEIFVTQTKPVDALRDQLPNRVLGISGSPAIDETAGKLLEDPTAQINLAKQQPTGVRCDRSTVERGHNLTVSKGLKLKLFSRTLLMQHRADPPGIFRLW